MMLVWGTDLSLSALALALAPFIKRSSLANPTGFAIYIVAWIFQLAIVLGFPFSPGAAIRHMLLLRSAAVQ